MKVSVVIPTKDRFDVLLKSLKGHANGIRLPDEIILVDDASEVPLEAALGSAYFPFKVKVFRNDVSRGAAVARNIGIRNSVGDIVVGHDDDVVPQPDMIAWHVFLHKKHPENSYGIMGRFVFDPERPRSALELYLEDEGPFSQCAKGVDGKLCDKGIITGNYSFKRSFAAGKRLFNETFPYNRNEDTEWSINWIREGWRPHYQRAPSGFHYSRLSAELYLKQAYQGGLCKGLWALQSPDDTDVVNRLCTLAAHKNQDLYTPELKSLCDCFDSIDASVISEKMRNTLFPAYSLAIQHAIKLGIVETWRTRVDGFSEILDYLSRFFLCTDERDGELLLSDAAQVNPGFLPMTLFHLDYLIDRKKIVRANEIIQSYSDNSIWFLTRKCLVESLLGDWSACAASFGHIYTRTQNPLHVSRLQRQAVAPVLEGILSREGRGQLSLPESLSVELKKEISICELEDLCSALFRSAERLGSSSANQEGYAPSAPLGKGQSGRLVWSSPDKGFGFIESVPKRITHFVGSGELMPLLGQNPSSEVVLCSFDSFVSSRGYEARNVKVQIGDTSR